MLSRTAMVAWLAAAGLAAACGGDGGARPDAGVLPDADLPDLSEELYAEDRLPRFDIELSAESRALLDADGTQYVPCTFRYADEVVEQVGIKLKGQSSFRPLSEKAAFKLKFDEFVPGQRFRGLARMTFNNAIYDPSFIAERLVYLAHREAGVPAPRANNATIYLDGAYRGVYANVEAEDRTFLARWFSSTEGNLYEGGHALEKKAPVESAEWLPGNEAEFELETNEAANDRSDLVALFAAAETAAPDTLLEDMGRVLDVEEWLRFVALEGLVSQWDGYAYTPFYPNNYRLYHDPATGRFALLPWGMDMALKPLLDLKTLEPVEGFDVLDVGQPLGASLFRRCLDGVACRARFREIVQEELARWATLGLADRARAMQGQIRADVERDAFAGVTVADFDGWVEVVYDQIARRAETAGDDL